MLSIYDWLQLRPNESAFGRGNLYQLVNPGCLLHMQLGIEKNGQSDKMKAVHIVDLIYDSKLLR